jgi:hypothetical protein
MFQAGDPLVMQITPFSSTYRVILLARRASRLACASASSPAAHLRNRSAIPLA